MKMVMCLKSCGHNEDVMPICNLYKSKAGLMLHETVRCLKIPKMNSQIKANSRRIQGIFCINEDDLPSSVSILTRQLGCNFKDMN